MKVLVINCGSSTIKYRLYQMPESSLLAMGIVERINEPGSCLVHQQGPVVTTTERAVTSHTQGMAMVLEALTSGASPSLASLKEIGACGHRVVHGGEEFTGSVLVDEKVLASIEKFIELAPLHNPHNLTGIRTAQEHLPGVPQVACFDTAFHTTLPPVAYLYALPYELYEKYQIRRYGFHGISHRYVARRAATILGKGKYDVNLISCHMGNGCSLAAIRGGRSIDTSMGFTPLPGIAMGTRPGDFDPAILLYLAGKGYDVATLNALCNKKSGLLGISGFSYDMRTLGEAADQGCERAKLAIEIFCYSVRKYIGAYLAVLGNVDALIMTGGIGENAINVRARILGGMERLGIVLDRRRNSFVMKREGEVGAAESAVRILVIPTNEEAAIASDTFAIVQEGCASRDCRAPEAVR